MRSHVGVTRGKSDELFPKRGMDNAKKLKNCLLGEAKKEEWRKNIKDEEYAKNVDLIHELHKKNLETVSSRNKRFKHEVVAKRSKVPVSRKPVSARAQRAYKKWKEQNSRDLEFPEVSVQNLLHLIHYLKAEPIEKEQTELDECLKRQNSDYEIFWDSPTYILKVLRKCVLTRDWANMTYFSLILLNHGAKYLPIIKNMCRIMVKYYALVKECDLEDQFKTLLEPKPEALVIV